MVEEFAMEDATQLLESASEFALYPGAQNEASVRVFLDRFPLPVIFSALQTKSDMRGLEDALVACLERIFQTKYGASLIPHYMPFVQVGLSAQSPAVRSLACKTVTYLLENFNAEDNLPVQLVISNGIYPLLLDSILKGDEQVAHAATDAIKTFARFPDALTIIFPADTDATHLARVAQSCSSLGRVRILSLVVKLFSLSPSVSSLIKDSKLLDLMEAEIKNTEDTLVILNVLELYFELVEIEHSSEFLPRTALIKLLCSIISSASMGSILKSRAMVIGGRLLSKDNIYNFMDEASNSVKELISAIDSSLESSENDIDTYESALEALGQIGSTTKGANLVLSTSPPAARHVVASAFDRPSLGKQLAALHALANIVGETRPRNKRVVDDKSEENLRCLIYDVASQSTKLTPSGMFLSVLQQSSESRVAGYRTFTALVSRPWCLAEILSKEDIINLVTDSTTETSKTGMEARYNCCKAIHVAFMSSGFANDLRCVKIGKKLEEAVRSGPYMSKYRDARPEVMTADRF